jgi:predicted nucleic acid-binding protein
MPINSEFLIPDTSCLILLSKISAFEVLEGFNRQILVTPEIVIEFGQALPPGTIVKEPVNQVYQRYFEKKVDKGEASAIVLAIETPKSLLIVDDLKARLIADDLGIQYSGTLGLILRAKQEGIIPGVRPLITKIRGTNFRFSESLLNAIIQMANES